MVGGNLFFSGRERKNRVRPRKTLGFGAFGVVGSGWVWSMLEGRGGRPPRGAFGRACRPARAVGGPGIEASGVQICPDLSRSVRMRLAQSGCGQAQSGRFPTGPDGSGTGVEVSDGACRILRSLRVGCADIGSGTDILLGFTEGWEAVDDLHGLDADGGDSLDQVDDVAPSQTLGIPYIDPMSALSQFSTVDLTRNASRRVTPQRAPRSSQAAKSAISETRRTSATRCELNKCTPIRESN